MDELKVFPGRASISLLEHGFSFDFEVCIFYLLKLSLDTELPSLFSGSLRRHVNQFAAESQSPLPGPEGHERSFEPQRLSSEGGSELSDCRSAQPGQSLRQSQVS